MVNLTKILLIVLNAKLEINRSFNYILKLIIFRENQI